MKIKEAASTSKEESKVIHSKIYKKKEEGKKSERVWRWSNIILKTNTCI